MLTYKKIKPFQMVATKIGNDEDEFWVLISYVPKEHIIAIEVKQMSAFVLSSLIILLILGAISFILAERKISDSEKKELIEKKNLELKDINNELFYLSSRDGLTGVYNRRYTMKVFEEKYSHNSEDKQISCVIFDLDKFKSINDTYGHLVGDVVLKKVTKVVSENITSKDIFGRYGGDEFLLILLDKSKDEVDVILKSIRKNIHEMDLDIDGKIIKVTLSIGAVDLSSDVHDTEDMMVLADLALYKAKETGRNRVEWYV